MQGGLQPHAYCLPVLKREKHRQAVFDAATSGNPKFFLGTDSAPHAREAKVGFSKLLPFSSTLHRLLYRLLKQRSSLSPGAGGIMWMCWHF